MLRESHFREIWIGAETKELETERRFSAAAATILGWAVDGLGRGHGRDGSVK